MPAYRYRAILNSGQIQRGRLVAANENALAAALRDRGQELISAQMERAKSWNFHARRHSPHDAKQRILMCGYLTDLLRSGLPLLDALRETASAMPSGRWTVSCHAIADDVAHGMSLTQSFAAHPELFDFVFISLLRIGEISGDLPACFTQLAEHLRWQERVGTQIKRALRYPLFLMLVATATTSFMLTMVVPQIVDFLLSTGGELPLSTKILIAFSKGFSACWWLALATSFVLFFTLRFFRQSAKSFALFQDRLLLSLPVLGPTLRQFATARFAENFAVLLKNGVALPESLALAATTFTNQALREAAKEAQRAVIAGTPLSKAATSLFPPLVIQMLRIGEQSGQLNKALQDVTRHYDLEVKDRVERLIAAIEPALTILVGGLLAWVVLAVLGPIYGNLAHLSQVP